jgi:hypothetical protein
MDVLSHALWGYAMLRWRGPRTARWGALTGAAPDLLYFGADRVVRGFRQGWSGLTSSGGRGTPGIWLRDGPPMPPELIEAYESYYVWTHSLVVIGLLAVAWWVLSRRAPWLLLPWGVHILMDIPTHERYLTQFLYPLSSFSIEGYAWSRPPVLLANWGALLVTYAALFWRYWRPGRPHRTAPWPEDRGSAARCARFGGIATVVAMLVAMLDDVNLCESAGYNSARPSRQHDSTSCRDGPPAIVAAPWVPEEGMPICQLANWERQRPVFPISNR